VNVKGVQFDRVEEDDYKLSVQTSMGSDAALHGTGGKGGSDWEGNPTVQFLPGHASEGRGRNTSVQCKKLALNREGRETQRNALHELQNTAKWSVTDSIALRPAQWKPTGRVRRQRVTPAGASPANHKRRGAREREKTERGRRGRQ